MANYNGPYITYHYSITDEYIRELLECPVCKETIKSVPVYQCNNGHVICKDCIKKLNNCPICRNDSAPARNLQLEKIVERIEGIQPENEGTTTAKPNLQKWGEGSVRSYGTINGPIQGPHIEPNLQATPGLHSYPRATYATLRLATPRQVAPRQATSNQDEESALLQGDMVGNMAQSIKNFFKNVGIFFCRAIEVIIITFLAILGFFGVCLFIFLIILWVYLLFVVIIQLLYCGHLSESETWYMVFVFWQC